MLWIGHATLKIKNHLNQFNQFKEGEQVLVTLSSEDKLPYHGSLKKLKIYLIKIIKNQFLVHAECFSEHTVPLILEKENIILLNRL